MADTLTITRPDDWHIHLRDEAMLATAVPATARVFARAIAMPNLQPPVVTPADAQAYYQRIQAATPVDSGFTPLMTLYLTDNTTPEMVREAAAQGIVKACKLYPANATTNSAHGVTDLDGLDATFEAMAEVGLLLLVHGEVTADEVDVFDREKAFIDAHLSGIVTKYPQLKVVFEHITTGDAAEFVLASGNNVAATITPQHLMYNRNHLLVGGIKPHNYCLPVLKRNTHQQALQAAVASGSSKFFLGTDSAPHLQHAKENACGCAGCYSAPAALELYAEIFEQIGALDKLEAFASFNGPDFYGLPRNTDTVTLVRDPWQIPATVDVAGKPMVPFYAGETLQWQVR
ncbi:dihydroorotase [Corallincola spongiicola]|uniref:Dihydroorotase n=1 Tax=Corallincola spongiicola TaxID=2520508 RepID=A0ABY1WPL9_9GAMM|nr:dihydroorotase [Corallincola spongiicola]TAA46025.1 dihydroorotase [Corallincola spongiicola]